MNAINELINEHKAVKLTLQILDKISMEIEKTQTIADAGHLEQLFDFFATFVDRCHHSKEEELLFPALEKVGISRNGGPIGVMLAEHQQGRNLVGEMKNATAELLNGDTDAARRFKAHADTYIALLNAHIDKEDNVLYPLAVRHLTADKLAALKEAFDRVEAERIGAGKHEAFHEMLDVLQKTYLQ